MSYERLFEDGDAETGRELFAFLGLRWNASLLHAAIASARSHDRDSSQAPISPSGRDRAAAGLAALQMRNVTTAGSNLTTHANVRLATPKP